MDHPADRSGEERAVRDVVLAGDVDAWGLLYAAHFDRLAAYARWRCAGLEDLTEDVIQEAWLTAVRRLRTFDPAKGPFFAWLCGIVSNAARTAVRGRRRERYRRRSLDHADTPSAATDWAAIEKAERVALALATLPAHYEAVLRAKYMDQQPVARIAANRNETPKAVESLLTRAREAFRSAYLNRARDHHE